MDVCLLDSTEEVEFIAPDLALIEDDIVDKVDKVETEKEVDVCLLDSTEEVGFAAPDLAFTKENDVEKDMIDTKEMVEGVIEK